MSKPGPNTPAGALRAPMSNFKDGDCAPSPYLLRHEDPAAFQRLVDWFNRRHQPQDAVEEDLVINLASVEWRLQRASTLPASLAVNRPQLIRSRNSILRSLALLRKTPHPLPAEYQ